MSEQKVESAIPEPETMGEYEKKKALAHKMLREGKGVGEIRGATDLPRSSIYKLKKSLEKEEKKEAAKPTVIENVEVTSPKLEDLTTEETKETTAEEDKTAGLVSKALEGVINEEELQILIEQINNFLEDEDHLTDKNTRLLTKMWKGPINRWLAQYEDVDVKIAALITIAILLPKVVSTVRKKLKKRGEVKK